MRSNMQIGAFIPVRLGSERLPRKHLQLIQGRPVLQHLLDRVFASKYIDATNVIVCTTCESEDDQLQAIVEKSGARLFRGERDDIIKRFYDALQKYPLDIIAEIDGDDPCIDTLYLDRCIEEIMKDVSLDIVLPVGLPTGVASKVFTKHALQHVYQIYGTTKNDTGFMWYFTKTGICKVLEISPESIDHIDDNIRLTLDYPEDLKFFRELFARLYQPGKIFNVRDIVALCKSEPALIKINAGVQKKFVERTQQLAKLAFKRDGLIYTVE